MLSLNSMANITSLSEVNKNTIEILVKDTIKNTEKSLLVIESDSITAQHYLDEALKSIKHLRDILSPDTHAEYKSPIILDSSKEYWFTYPQVSNHIFENEQDFPTIHSKLNSEILYRGIGNNNLDKDLNEQSAFFDYAFAHASLLSAKDAIKSDNHREAKRALKRVFEAIYISPDFLITKYDHKFKIDNLLNIKGDYPVYSNLEYISNVSG